MKDNVVALQCREIANQISREWEAAAAQHEHSNIDYAAMLRSRASGARDVAVAIYKSLLHEKRKVKTEGASHGKAS